MKKIENVQPPPKTRSLGELNQRLQKMKEERSRLAQAGEMSVAFNYKQLTSKIPTQATGVIGAHYYEQEIKPMAARAALRDEDDEDVRALSEASRALRNIKKKLKREEVREAGYPINEKQRPQSSGDFEQPIAELFDLPNPHYRKLFDAAAFYKINDSDDEEDPLEKEQRDQINAAAQFNQENAAKKNRLLQRLNQNIKVREQEQEEELQKQEIVVKRQAGIKSIMKKNQSHSAQRQSDQAVRPKQIVRIAGREYEQPSEKVLRFEGDNDDQKPIDLNKLPKWKLKSEAFRAALRSASKGQAVSDAENQIIVDALNNNALVKCEHCGRKFSEKAAEHHIPHCYDKMLTDKMKTQRRKKKNLKL